ncbi:MAG: prolipoprotein diacylglyceryl transferase family protein [Mycobacteriales bacterium]
MSSRHKGRRPGPKNGATARSGGSGKGSTASHDIDGLLRAAQERGLVAPSTPPAPRPRAPRRPHTPAEPLGERPPGDTAAEPARTQGGSVAAAPPGSLVGAGSRSHSAQVAAASGCVESMESAEGVPLGLVATYRLQIPPAADRDGDAPLSVAVRFIGRRTSTDQSKDPRDRFEQVEQVHGLPVGVGLVTVTTKVLNVNAGQWQVTAEHALGAEQGESSPAGTRRPPRPAAATRQEMTGRTQLTPLLRGPGVRIVAWPVLVLIGVFVAVALQALLLQRSQGQWRYALIVSPISVLVGYLVAKFWYLVMHRQHPRRFASAGTYIQGFVLGTFTTASGLLALTGRPVGPFLDATAPGLFLAMAIGRPGCFLGGCCVGRPTASRWGLWSSDRRVAVRRIPVQLFEAAATLVLGLVALALYLTVPLPVPGALFVGGVAAYTASRQLLFPLRREQRRTSSGRRLTLIASVLTVCAALAVSVLAAPS